MQANCEQFVALGRSILEAAALDADEPALSEDGCGVSPAAATDDRKRKASEAFYASEEDTAATNRDVFVVPSYSEGAAAASSLQQPPQVVLHVVDALSELWRACAVSQTADPNIISARQHVEMCLSGMCDTK